MFFYDQSHKLNELFDLSRDEILIPNSNVRVRNYNFSSDTGMRNEFPDLMNDTEIRENYTFRYPVFVPASRLKSDQAILFLHGLNERCWSKHLESARFLAEKTNKPVIMFPLSFHINRGLPEWSDSRKMLRQLEARKKKYPDIHDASVANIALSERLTDDPRRFFVSGYQSASDIMKLMHEIQDGNHPLFDSGTHMDIFAYSISCMVLQAMMINNPGNILGNSKIVFFAGGSLFSSMNGISRYIMDNVAFQSIRNCYLNLASKNKATDSWLLRHEFGKAFRALVTPDKFMKEGRKAFQSFSGKMMIIALRDDKVIPLEGIRSVVGEKFFRSNRFKTVHFPYGYMHENPFPVLNTALEEQVEKAFMSVFDPVARFFTG